MKLLRANSRLRDRAAITGIGITELSKNSGRGLLSLTTEAALSAISDAGLRPQDIDGLVTFYWGQRDTPAPSEMADALGLVDCAMSFCDSSGGAWAAAAVAAAAMAVTSGTCKHVLVYRGANSRSAPVFGPGSDVWPSGRRQWSEPIGDASAHSLYAPYVSAYLAEYGLDNTDFASLAVLQRSNAGLNTKALMRTPISSEDHQKSPWIVRPFRLLDCSVWNDGAAAIVVSSTPDARRMGSSPVSIRAVRGGTLGAPVASRTGAHFWQLHAHQLSSALYRSAGMTVDNIDVAELYDPFTGIALMHVEQFGLAAPGTAPAAIREGFFGLDGEIALNTHGGNLSEGNLMGMGHIVEAVQQLRSEGVRDDMCGSSHTYKRDTCRQRRDAGVALVCGESGDSGMILTAATA